MKKQAKMEEKLRVSNIHLIELLAIYCKEAVFAKVNTDNCLIWSKKKCFQINSTLWESGKTNITLHLDKV